MPCATSSGLPLFGCCGVIQREAQIQLYCSWLNYYPTAVFIDRQIATAVEYVNNYDLQSLPINLNVHAFYVQLSPAIELTVAAIEAAFQQKYHSDLYGEAVNGSGWAGNINFAGMEIQATRTVIKAEIRQRVCRAIKRRTYNQNPPPEYLDVFTECNTVIEDAGLLSAAVAVGGTSSYVQSTTLRQADSTHNGIWIYNAFPIRAPGCCDLTNPAP